MFGISRSTVARLKLQFPAGTKVELLEMEDDPRPIEPGTRGIVVCVDDAGSIHVDWENGRSLAVIPGQDSFRKVSE